jgi:hypothetical protein
MKYNYRLICLIILISCKDSSVPVISRPCHYDYVVFGSLGSFRMNPDVLFKVINDSVFTTNRLPVINVNMPPAYRPFLTPDSLVTAFKMLAADIPDQLCSESRENIGSASIPDSGYIYIEIGTSNSRQHWNVLSSPPYLANFIKQLGKDLSEAAP